MVKYVFVLQNRMPEHRSGALQTTGMEGKVLEFLNNQWGLGTE